MQNALGVPADYAKAMEWNNRAAQQGNAQGQAQIGYLYQNGLGVTQNLVAPSGNASSGIVAVTSFA